MSDSDATRKKPPGTPPADPHKAALELRKLELEIKALTFKQSRLGRLTEILQGVVPILAILSLVWTVVVGLNQQEAQRKDAESARFERAFAKLGSSVPSERVTGVAQASALLHAAGGERDRDILTALANQLALDPNPAVRSAILSVLSTMDASVGQPTLDATLKNIVDLHRVLVQSAGFTPFELSTAQKDNRGIYFIPRASDAIPLDQQMVDETFVRLESLSAALMAVLKAGGRTRAMDHIYCPDCAFDSLRVDFSDVSFQNAVLPRSQWNLMRLARSNFQGAVITRANFTGAELEGADFSAGPFDSYREEYVAANGIGSNDPERLPRVLDNLRTGDPNFICANLKNARFDNFLLLSRVDDSSAAQAKPAVGPDQRPRRAVTATATSDGPMRNFLRANIDGADFANIRELVIRRVPAGEEKDPYIRTHAVRTSERTSSAYYYTTMELSYLRYYERGTNAAQDRERDITVQVLAQGFVVADNAEQAELPTGVREALKAERAKQRPSTFPTCDVYLKSLREARP